MTARFYAVLLGWMLLAQLLLAQNDTKFFNDDGTMHKNGVKKKNWNSHTHPPAVHRTKDMWATRDPMGSSHTEMAEEERFDESENAFDPYESLDNKTDAPRGSGSVVANTIEFPSGSVDEGDADESKDRESTSNPLADYAASLKVSIDEFQDSETVDDGTSGGASITNGLVDTEEETRNAELPVIPDKEDDEDPNKSMAHVMPIVSAVTFSAIAMVVVVM